MYEVPYLTCRKEVESKFSSLRFEKLFSTENRKNKQTRGEDNYIGWVGVDFIDQRFFKD